MQRIGKFILQWWDAILALVGAVVSGYDIIAPFTTLGAIRNEYLLPISLGIFLVFGLIAIFRSKSTLNAYENTLPKIVASDAPKWELKGWRGNIWRWALGIEFKNVAVHPSENNAALKVSATVKWIDMNGNLVRENHGRWHITNRARDEQKVEMQTVDIYPNNQEAKLHFAIRSVDNKHLYAWGRIKDDSHEEFELGEKNYVVEVVLFDSRGLRWLFKYPVVNQELHTITTQTGKSGKRKLPTGKRKRPVKKKLSRKS